MTLRRYRFAQHASILAAMAIVLCAGSLTGCATVSKIFADPKVVTGIIGGVVAAMEDTGTSEATINAQAVKALAVAKSTTMTIAQVQASLQAIPGISNAVTIWMQENPELAQVQANLTTWLQAIVDATTPLTVQRANVQLRLQARRARAAAKVTMLPGFGQPAILPALCVTPLREALCDGTDGSSVLSPLVMIHYPYEFEYE